MAHGIKQRLFQFWLYSYLIILFIPIVISMVVLFQSQSLLDHEVRRANDTLLAQIQQSLDNQIKDIRRLGTQLSVDPKLVRYLVYPELNSTDKRMEAMELIPSLRSYAIANGVISDFYIYIKEKNYALTTTTLLQSDLMYATLKDQISLSFGEWKTWAEKFHYGSFINLRAEQGGHRQEDSLVYVQSIPLQEMNEAPATLVVHLNQERLKQSITSMELANEGSVVIVDGLGRVITATEGTPAVSSTLLEAMNGTKGFLKAKLDGEEVALSYLTSEEADWIYVSLVPSSIYSHKVTLLRTLIYVSLLVCIILGGVIAYLLAKRNYRPIRQMMDLVSHEVKLNMKDTGNEYSILHAFLTESASAQNKFNQKLQEQHQTLRSHFLARLLKGRVDTEAALAQAFKSYDLQFETDCFAVLLFHMEDYRSLFRSKEELDSEKKRQFVYLIVTNITEELISRNHKVYSTEVDGMIACLVNIKGASLDAEKDLISAATEAHSFLENNFLIKCSIGLSNVQMLWSSIPACYEQAVEALEYKLVLGASQIIPFAMIGRPKQELYYPLDMERQIMNLMATGSYEEATAMVQEILRTNFSGGTLSVQMGKLLMFELVGTMMKAVEQIQLSTKELLVEKTDLIRQMTECGTFADMEEEIFNFLKLVCDYMQQKKKSHNTNLKEQIVAHIDGNLHDAGMSLTSLSHTFDINPSYLSKFFKEQTGENLNEYVNKRRVELAKQLLVQTLDTVNDITEKCGFNNSNYFIRVFKKHEGITPGQFRQMEE
ncbi:MAG: hypothetical protein K0R57_1417 [Paenibacillaceae bacterium]|nr:hypothetical protein [Paenibacillaceae bacterium]